MPRYYWDACAWIGLINEEPDKNPACTYVIELARNNQAEIVTSTFSLAEVYKRKCEGVTKELAEENDEKFESFLEQDFVIRRQVDQDVGLLARGLLRTHEGLNKPQDAIHLATAILSKVDEFHTFDGSDLLPLDGKIDIGNERTLKICTPPLPPVPDQGELFNGAEQEEQKKESKEELVAQSSNPGTEDESNGEEEVQRKKVQETAQEDSKETP